MPRPSAPPATPVVTMLTPDERTRVDAAGLGRYHTLHRDSVDDVLRDLRTRRATAVLVSVSRCTERDAARMALMVREFPRVPAVALLTQLERGTPQAVLSLGRSGVEHLVDVRAPGGWHALREVLGRDHQDPFSLLVLETIGRDLAGATPDCLRFFRLLFLDQSAPTTVRTLARQLGVVPSTLMSRFFRARLPAPKRYLAMSRLVRAARLFENPGLSVAGVANMLDYSSPQSFGRHVRTMLRMTAGEFRERYDGEGMLHRFREELVMPFLPALRLFTPFSMTPGWLAPDARRRLAARNGVGAPDDPLAPR
ncbi:MAG: helix-turn-helix transcriptional regulator [Gemmatimonadaceae bacterium]